MFTDQVSELAHLNARDTTFAIVSRAPQAQIEQLKRRMGWTMPWYTVVGEDFQKALGTSEYFALNVFLRDGDRSSELHDDGARGRGAGQRLDLPRPHAPGSREEWEDTPPGRPQSPPYQWWRLHDRYEASA